MASEGDRAGAGGGGGTGDVPPEGQRKGGEAKGTGQDGGGGSGSGSGDVKTVPINILPEPLRNRPQKEVQYLLENMVRATQNTAKENQELKKQLKELKGDGRGKPTSTHQAGGSEDAGGEGTEDLPLEELILKDPAAAVRKVIQENYGDDLSELSEGVGESMYHTFRNEIPDFREYEDDIRKILNESGARPNKENIQGAYLLAVGRKTVEERQRANREQDSVETGGGAPPDEGDQRNKTLTPLEKEVAQGLYPNDPDAEKRYLEAREKWREGKFEVKVPDGSPRGGRGGDDE